MSFLLSQGIGGSAYDLMLQGWGESTPVTPTIGSLVLSQGVWGTASDILIQGWARTSSVISTGPYPDPFLATSVVATDALILGSPDALVLSQGAWGSAYDLFLQGWLEGTANSGGNFPDPFAATSALIAPVASQSATKVGGWFGAWFGLWFGRLGTITVSTSSYPDPFAATSEPQDTLSDWIEDPASVPWHPANPEPDPDSFATNVVLLVELTDQSGWLVKVVSTSDPTPELDWSTVIQWAATTLPFPDPTKATSVVMS